VLQEREVRPVGASQAHPVDVRLVFATNRQLRDEVAAGHFREDLFYRIAVVEVALPALRERPEDIPALAARILSRAAVQLGRRPPRLEQAALRALVAHAWPGNVRQLENVLTRACLMAESEVVRREDLAFGRAVPDAAQATEARRILDELEATRWNAREAAAKLGIPRATFYRTLRRLGISRPSRTG
jgi:DNA-binding NtrC family response regulator